MALVGGGGAGNIAGSNPTGTSQGLNYLGDHCYATSGPIAADSGNEVTMVDFTTGNGYILAKMEFTHRLITGYRVGFFVFFNEEKVLIFDTDGVPPFNDNHTYRFIIPAHTHVKVNWFQTNTTSHNATLIISGRVYTE